MKLFTKDFGKTIKRIFEANINLEHYWFIPRLEKQPVRVETLNERILKKEE